MMVFLLLKMRPWSEDPPFSSLDVAMSDVSGARMATSLLLSVRR